VVVSSGLRDRIGAIFHQADKFFRRFLSEKKNVLFVDYNIKNFIEHKICVNFADVAKNYL